MSSVVLPAEIKYDVTRCSPPPPRLMGGGYAAPRNGVVVVDGARAKEPGEWPGAFAGEPVATGLGVVTEGSGRDGSRSSGCADIAALRVSAGHDGSGDEAGNRASCGGV